MGEHWIHPDLKKLSKLEMAEVAVEILAANLVAKGFTRRELSKVARHFTKRLQIERPKYDQTS